MIRAFVLAVLVTGLAFAPWSAAADPAAKKADPTADLLDKLRKPVDLNVADEVRLAELADLLAAKFGVPVMVNVREFRETGIPAADDMMVKLPRAKGLSLNTVLRHTLEAHGVTFLVRKDHLELVPQDFAARVTKNLTPGDMPGGGQAREPLVSAIYKEKPLNEAVADLADEYNLTVVVSPQTGDNRSGFVSARLLNVPADKALELLALQADLRVVRKGSAYLITGKDHANELHEEAFQREMKKVELARLKITPLPPPADK